MLNLESVFNNLQLPFLDCINISDVLQYPMRYSKKLTFISYVKKLIYLFLRSFISGYTTKYYDGADEINDVEVLIFPYSPKERYDHYSNYTKLCKLIGNAYSIEYNKPRLSFNQFKNIKKLFIWNRLLKEKIDGLQDRFNIVFELYIIYLHYFEINSLLTHCKMPFHRITVWCDVMPVESLVVQKMNMVGYTTVSLQHGMHSASFDSFAFTGSRSKIYLAGNQYTINEAKALGFGQNMIPVGMVGSIGIQQPIIQYREYRIKAIGLFLDSYESHNLNLELVEFMKSYCIKKNMQLCIKLHPTEMFCASEYSKILKDGEHIWTNDISLQEFSHKIDLAVVRFSTCLLQMMELGIPSLSFYSNSSKRDMYKNCNLDIRFSDELTLNRLISKIESENYFYEFIKNRKFFYIDNAEENYENFYSTKGSK